MELYKALLAIKAEMDNHYSDLYVKASPKATALIKQSGHSHTYFISQIDGKQWIDVPFAYTPWWDKKLAKGKV